MGYRWHHLALVLAVGYGLHDVINNLEPSANRNNMATTPAPEETNSLPTNTSKPNNTATADLADQRRIYELETRIAELELISIESIPEAQIISPINGDLVYLSDPVELVVVAFDPSGINNINIVFDNNPSLEIHTNGEKSIIIQEPWPLSEAGEHTAVITAVNNDNISSKATIVTITVEGFSANE